MFHEMKAEPMTTSQLDRWLSGKIPRRHLALPFGGPLPSPNYTKGMDVEGEFFHEGTDFYGPYPQLRRTRDRLVDWHHVTFGDRVDPTGVMKGAVLGRIVLDEEASTEEVDGIEYAGIWSDFWANAGERKRELVGMLERRLVPLYGSSQPVQKAVRINAKTGAIDVWPVRFHTVTTSPTNTYAVMPHMKAWLDDPSLADMPIGALQAFLTGADLRPISGVDGLTGKAGATAADRADIDAALAGLRERLAEFWEARSSLHTETETT